ncbi:unnamed protein product [Amoebophrya sp. A120]|nr:unnamed protein product [Amoebophrya sp. A120]|eukprot:GSA120T00003169001.1
MAPRLAREAISTKAVRRALSPGASAVWGSQPRRAPLRQLNEVRPAARGGGCPAGYGIARALQMYEGVGESSKAVPRCADLFLPDKRMGGAGIGAPCGRVCLDRQGRAGPLHIAAPRNGVDGCMGCAGRVG